MREPPSVAYPRGLEAPRAATRGARRLLDERGQALVEFALILPLFLLLLLGMIDFGIAYNDHNDMTQLAGEAVRFAAVDTCGTGCTSIATQVRNDADNAGLANGSGGTFGTDQKLEICFWYPQGSGTQGGPVQAIVETNYQPLPFLGLSFTKIQLKATATMRIETARSGTGDVYSADSNVTSSSSNCTGYKST